MGATVLTPHRLGSRSASSSVYGFPRLSPTLGLEPSPRARHASRRDSLARASPKKKRPVADRFIPNREASWLNQPDPRTSQSECARPSSTGSIVASQNKTESPASELAQACGVRTSRILEFQLAAPQTSNPLELRNQYSRGKQSSSSRSRRTISSVPERILDAPGLVDDYYLNLLDWSGDNEVAIALDQSVYIWNASSGTVNELAHLEGDQYVSSVRWSTDGYLSIGSSSGDIQIWDIESQNRVRTMTGRNSRVSCTAWSQHMLLSGARDGAIWQHDVRIKDHNVAQLFSHQAEVCGLEWRNDGTQFASGGNDNLVNIWDPRASVPKFTKTNHKSAVKALAWCPWQKNLLATGGGTQDKQIHFWNTTTGSRVNTVDAQSQVTSLHWSVHNKEIVSTHGFPNNKLTVWSYPTMEKIASIDAHESRILASALSPDGLVLATCAADENLKFWKVFEGAQRRLQAGPTLTSQDMSKCMMIR